MADPRSGWLRLGALGALLVLATCQLEPEQADYTKRFPIAAKAETVTVPASKPGPAGFDALVADYLDRGHGPIVVGGVAPLPQLEAVRKHLIAAGVPASEIRMAAGVRGTALGVMLSYERYTVVPPDCGSNWSAPMQFNPANTDYPAFGCAQQHNLGIMLADPADIASMHPAAPSDAQNTDRVIRAYRAGNVTNGKQGAIQDSADQNVAAGTNPSASTPLPTSTR